MYRYFSADYYNIPKYCPYSAGLTICVGREYSLLIKKWSRNDGINGLGIRLEKSGFKLVSWIWPIVGNNITKLKC